MKLATSVPPPELPAIDLDVFDQFDAATLQNPYPAYARMHARGPVLWSERLSCVYVLGRAEADAAMRHPDLEVMGHAARMRSLADQTGDDFDAFARTLDAIVFFNNPPTHARERRAVARALLAPSIAAYAPMIAAIVQDLMAPARDGAPFDAVRDLADRLPYLFFGRLLGLEDDEIAHLSTLSPSVIRALAIACPLREIRPVASYARLCMDLILDRIGQRRRAPRDDVLTRLVDQERTEAAAEGRAVDDRDIAARACALFMVGTETTSMGIGAAALCLAGHPDAQARLRADRSRIGAAVEEVLRVHSAVQMIRRTPTEDRRLGGVVVPAGAVLVLLLGAANRDPRVYADPDRFDLDRFAPASGAPPHIAFGTGLHTCVGAGLSRLEMETCLNALLDLKPFRQAEADAVWWPIDMVRRLRRLPLVPE